MPSLYFFVSKVRWSWRWVLSLGFANNSTKFLFFRCQTLKYIFFYIFLCTGLSINISAWPLYCWTKYCQAQPQLSSTKLQFQLRLSFIELYFQFQTSHPPGHPPVEVVRWCNPVNTYKAAMKYFGINSNCMTTVI